MNRTEQFPGLVLRRASCRSYKTDPVPRSHLDQVLETARQAPSACNRQPWRFAVVQDEEKRRSLVTDSFLPGLPMKWAHNAPVIIGLGFQRSVITHRVAPGISGIDYALMDLGIAGEHLVLAATELGLGTCWIGWIRPRIVEKIVGWPSGIHARALITVGWPAAEVRGSCRPRYPVEDITTWL